jgi:uncharacterized repeat protein (TIGR01451 family)
VTPAATIVNVADIVKSFGVPKADRDATPATTWREYPGPQDTVTLTVAPFADLEVVKTVDQPEHSGGDTVTWTVKVTNHGPSSAQNVTVDDPLPGKVTFVSVTPSPACGLVATTVHCNLGGLAAGATKTVTITTQAKGLPGTSGSVQPHTHQLTVAKDEQSVVLQAGETRTVDLSCSNGGAMSDGSAEIMHVDQGTGSAADVLVRRASSVAPGTYRFTLVNTTTGQAQTKVFGTCLPHDTELTDGHRHGLDVGALVSLPTGAMTPGRHTFVVPVSPGHRAIAPGLEVLSGNARLVASEPVAGGWQFTVEALENAEATLSLRELGERTLVAGSPAHTHTLGFLHVVRSVTLAPGESVERVSCPTGSKGVVGTYELPPGVVLLGHEPQPINRDFRLLNTTNGNVSVMLDLECLAIETGSPHDEVITVTNTATAATTTFEPDLGNNTDSASIQLTVSPGSAGPTVQAVQVAGNGGSASVTATCKTSKVCSGTMRLTAKVRSGGHTERVVIGTSHYRIKRGHTHVVRVVILSRFRDLVRHGRVTSYRVF